MSNIAIALVALIFLSINTYSQQLITGRVIDEQTGISIKEAEVETKHKGNIAKTNFLGYFQLDPSGIDSLTVSAEGYQSLTFSIPKSNSFKVALKKSELIFYKNGMKSWYFNFQNNLRYPSYARSSGKQGKIYVSFQIDSVGNLNNITLLNDIGGGCGAEVLKVLKKVPNHYIPDKSNTLYILPVIFRIENTQLDEKEFEFSLPKGKILPEIVVSAFKM